MQAAENGAPSPMAGLQIRYDRRTAGRSHARPWSHDYASGLSPDPADRPVRPQALPSRSLPPGPRREHDPNGAYGGLWQKAAPRAQPDARPKLCPKGASRRGQGAGQAGQTRAEPRAKLCSRQYVSPRASLAGVYGAGKSRAPRPSIGNASEPILGPGDWRARAGRGASFPINEVAWQIIAAALVSCHAAAMPP